jgi:hypothetical protein
VQHAKEHPSLIDEINVMLRTIMITLFDSVLENNEIMTEFSRPSDLLCEIARLFVSTEVKIIDDIPVKAAEAVESESNSPLLIQPLENLAPNVQWLLNENCLVKVNEILLARLKV